MKLVDVLNHPEPKARFIEASHALIEREVASKRGISGMALKTGFKAIRKVRPDIVPRALEFLLPHFAPVMEPHLEAAESSGDIPGFFVSNADRIAEDLLGVTDARAAKANNPVVRRTYRGLRGHAHSHTVEAMPAVGAMLVEFAEMDSP